MKKGQMLIVTIILISVFLAGLLSIYSVLINDQLNQKRIDAAAVAYYAAETGIEKGILQLKNDINQRDTGSGNIGGSSYSFTIADPDPADSDPDVPDHILKIKSIGKSGSVSRALEAEVPDTFSSGILWPKSWIEVAP